MKRILCAAGILALTCSVNVMASGGGQGDKEEFKQRIALQPTVNAPTNASGRVSLEIECENGTNSTELKVKLAGLPVSNYLVSVNDTTGTNAYDLGLVAVSLKSDDDCDDEDEDKLFGSTYSVVSTNSIVCTNTIPTGKGEFNLPSSLDATNVASVFIYDTNGVVMLTGGFGALTNYTGVFYSKTVSVTPLGATNCVGAAALKLAYKKGKTTGSFFMVVSNLPPKLPLTISVNGTGKVKTAPTKQGTLVVKNLPKTKLGSVQTVIATDKKGNQMFRADF